MKSLVFQGACLALGVAFWAPPAAAQTSGYYVPTATVAANYGYSFDDASRNHVGACASCGGVGCAACVGGEVSCDACSSGGISGRLSSFFSSNWQGMGSCQGCLYAGGAGLAFTRDDDDNMLLAYDGNGNTVLSTRDADFDYAGGFETWIGRYFNCGRNAIEARYWGIFPNTSVGTVWGAETPGGLNTFPEFDTLWIDDGAGYVPVAGLYDDAERHSVLRSYQVHNVELNVLGLFGPGALPSAWYDGSSNWAFTWLTGVRFMRFDDGLVFASSPDNTTFDDDNDVFYNADVINNLVGFQFGGRALYRVGCRLSLYSGLKWGIYNNHIRQCQSITTAGGAVAVAEDGPFIGQNFDISSTKDNISFLSEVDLGLAYRVTPCWSVIGGYRAIGVNGVALATNQYPRTYADNLGEAAAVRSNSSLILHGAYLGMSCNF